MSRRRRGIFFDYSDKKNTAITTGIINVIFSQMPVL